MVLKYTKGGIIRGTAADKSTVPANIPVNTLYVETDTNRMYKYSGSSVWDNIQQTPGLPNLTLDQYFVYKSGSDYNLYDHNNILVDTGTNLVTDVLQPVIDAMTASSTVLFQFDADDFETTTPLLIPAANQNAPKIVRLRGYPTATRASGTLIHPATTFPDSRFLIETSGAGPSTDLQPVLHVNGLSFYNLHFKDKSATPGKINVGGIQFECDDVGRRTCVIENSWFQYMWRGLELRGSVWWGYFRNLLFHDANTQFVGENDIRITDGSHTNATNPSVKECRFRDIEVKHDGKMNNSFVMRSGGYNKIDGYHVSGEEYITAVWNLTKLDTLPIHNNRFNQLDMIDVDTIPSPDNRRASLLLFGSTGIFDNDFRCVSLSQYPYMVALEGAGVVNNRIEILAQHAAVGSSINDVTGLGANNVIKAFGGNQATVANQPITTVNNLVRIIDQRAGAERNYASVVADGGTITHGLMTTPAWVQVTPSIASEFASVTAVSSTTFTVALKKHDNTAGTSQTVYWRAGIYLS